MTIEATLVILLIIGNPPLTVLDFALVLNVLFNFYLVLLNAKLVLLERFKLATLECNLSYCKNIKSQFLNNCIFQKNTYLCIKVMRFIIEFGLYLC